jgi:hypothetical protein
VSSVIPLSPLSPTIPSIPAIPAITGEYPCGRLRNSGAGSISDPKSAGFSTTYAPAHGFRGKCVPVGMFRGKYVPAGMSTPDVCAGGDIFSGCVHQRGHHALTCAQVGIFGSGLLGYAGLLRQNQLNLPRSQLNLPRSQLNLPRSQLNLPAQSPESVGAVSLPLIAHTIATAPRAGGRTPHPGL